MPYDVIGPVKCLFGELWELIPRHAVDQHKLMHCAILFNNEVVDMKFEAVAPVRRHIFQ